MKKLATILTALILLFSAGSFAASGDNVTTKIKTAFDKNFAAASSVEWKKMSGIYFAYFKLNDQSLSAAYSEDGEMLGATRSITLSQLPLNVSLALQNFKGGYAYNDNVTELVNDGQTTYFIGGDNSKCTVQLKSNASGDLTIEKKIRKK
ncbi:MAG: hypothetical protein H0W12_08400 [Chitinophagaceae bacterium]|nr:hypothetical protein [Chitinophagaceae bacterium]